MFDVRGGRWVRLSVLLLVLFVSFVDGLVKSWVVRSVADMVEGRGISEYHFDI